MVLTTITLNDFTYPAVWSYDENGEVLEWSFERVSEAVKESYATRGA